MGKESVEVLIQGGKATAAPPLGPAMGPLGVNIGQVVAEINKKTADFKGMQVPVKVTVDTESKEFEITIGTPPASGLIKKEISLQKGSGRPHEEFVADITLDQVLTVARMKQDGLLGKDMKGMAKEIIGTCQSMGITVEGVKAYDMQQKIAAGEFAEKFA